jgi:hypothetical protein
VIQVPRTTPKAPPPTVLVQLRSDAAVEHWIRSAKAAYVAGRTTVEQLEEDVAALLEDRPMPGHFAPRGVPRLEARMERVMR